MSGGKLAIANRNTYNVHGPPTYGLEPLIEKCIEKTQPINLKTHDSQQAVSNPYAGVQGLLFVLLLQLFSIYVCDQTKTVTTP